jgi:pimeloyl-ACP methyl ester carboxylesterase
MVRIVATHWRMWIVATAALYGCGDSQPTHARNVDCPSGPVILVHGLGQGPEIFDVLRASLEQRGLRRECLHAISYSTGNLPIRYAAEMELAPFVERVLAAVAEAPGTPATHKINLIGHSMGALSTRWYAARLRPERVRTWISTSGANHGTDWQCPQPAGTGHGDMCPAFARDENESSTQFALNGGRGPDVDETPYGLGRDSPDVRSVAPDAQRSILYMTVQVAADAYVLPNPSLLVDGAGGVALKFGSRAPWRETQPGNYLFKEPSGHDDVLETKALADFIYAAIVAPRVGPAAREPS